MDNNFWMRTHSYCKGGMDVTDGNYGNDGLNGVLVQLVWDGQLLVPAGMGTTEQERHYWLASY